MTKKELDDLSFDEENVCPNCGQYCDDETTCPHCGAILAEEDDEFDGFQDDEGV